LHMRQTPNQSSKAKLTRTNIFCSFFSSLPSEAGLFLSELDFIFWTYIFLSNIGVRPGKKIHEIMEKIDDAGDFKELILVCRYIGLEPGRSGQPEI